MNGKQARALRRQSPNRQAYRALKAQFMAADGQTPKFDKPRKHKKKRGIKPTWPATPDQMKQGRPAIYARPVHALCADTPERKLSEQVKRDLRAACNAMPKWLIDQAAARGFL